MDILLYTERREQYFLANDVGSEGKKRAILLSVCSGMSIPRTCIGVTMAHEVRRKFLNYYLFIRGVVDVATYVTYIMVHYRYY